MSDTSTLLDRMINYASPVSGQATQMMLKSRYATNTTGMVPERDGHPQIPSYLVVLPCSPKAIG